MTPEPKRGTATTRDQVEIAWALYPAQKKDAPRLALVHSLAMDGNFWQPVVEALQGQAEVLTIDCRGHGKSGKPAGPYSVEMFADDLAEVMAQVGWQRAIVGGASMGGSVALAFASRHAVRTQALALIDTTAWYGENAPANWAERADKARAEGLKALVGFQQTRWFSDRFREQQSQQVQACVNTFLRNEVDAFAATCHMLGSFDLRAALPGLHMPVAILVGEEDYATPVAMAQAMHAGVAHSTMQVIAGARHLTPVERPDVIAAMLLELAGRQA